MKAINKWPYFFALPFVLTYLAFHLYPTMYSLVLSFYEWNGIGDKAFVGLQNYVRLLTDDPLFFKSLYNTFVIMIMSIPATLLLGVTVAYLTFNAAKGRLLLQTVNFLPYITTPVAIGFIFSFMFDWQTGFVNEMFIRLGLLDEGVYWLQEPWSAKAVIALMIMWKHLGYFMIIYLAGMTAISQDIYEAAKIDGAGPLQLFAKITVPLLRNITVFLVVTSIISGLQLFDEPKLLYGGWSGSTQIGGPDNAALTVIWKFVDESFISNSNFGYSAAIAYLLFVIIILFSIVSYRLTAGKEESR
ncbi:carbohydrate ABC transporter permease [Paenibacillus arenilitoris]|uniref:Sugar ABC transporter permease n=1 Tax=Paenibacillus arenilitoris TaxID=2772299 RepID=A0A927CMJ4_9BACL|nr:sugar ABC transporter permease [Paenibacillus arenilitoris]MBD2870838.1 sugar ABC transporter permease [Paenibacillus arenilitoris]